MHMFSFMSDIADPLVLYEKDTNFWLSSYAK